jgi:hypothetical protein
VALRPVPERDADRQRHAVVRGRAGEGSGPHPVHSPDHEFRRKLRVAGDLAAHPRPRAAGGAAAGLVAGRPARTAYGHHPRGDPRLIGVIRITLWQQLGFYDYSEHWVLIAFTVGAALVGIVTFGSLAGSMLPFILQWIGFDPASASVPFMATLIDVTGLVIYFMVALAILRGTLL